MAEKKSGRSELNVNICKKLSHFLADSFVAYVQTLNFHWNMRGPEFFMYHKLLETQYKDLAEGIDELAERIRMLGGKAPGTLEAFLKLATLPETSKELSQKQMIEELAKSHKSLSERAHSLIQFTDEHQDPGTSDLLIERMRFHDMQRWLLHSHLA